MRRPFTKKSWKTRIFLTFLSIFMLIGITAWFALRHGISINRIQLPSVLAERVWIQVKKGIMISIERLDIQDSDAATSIANPERYISSFNAWSYLFREIRIRQINAHNQTYSLLYKNNRFTLSGDSFQLISTLTYAKNEALFNIQKFEIKPYSITLTGDGVFSRAHEQFDFSGMFHIPETSGRLSLSLQGDQVNAEIETDQFTNLAGLLAHSSLDQEVTTWISENIHAQQYRFEQLRLNATLRDGKPDIRPHSITGRAIASDAAIIFHPSLPPVKSKQVQITYANDRLSFNLDTPTFGKKNLDGSTVTIDNLLFGSSSMDINIRTDSRLDLEILELLASYDIALPFIQKTGSTKADLHLLFDLPEYSLHTTGSFTTAEGNWACKDMPFQTDGATVRLKDNLVTIDNAEIQYKDNLTATVGGTVDTDTNQALLNADIEQFNLRDGEKNIVRANNLTTPLTLRFSGSDINVQLHQLQTGISLSPSRRHLTIYDLNKVKPYLPSLKDFPIEDGNLNINFTNTEKLLFDGSVTTNALPLSLNKKPVTLFNFNGSKSAEKLTAAINDRKISLTIAETINIQLLDYLVTVDTKTLGQKAGFSSPVPIVISGPNSLIKLTMTSIPTNNFTVELLGQEVIFTAELDQGRILFESEAEEKALAATDIDAKLAQDFFLFADLGKGKFNLSLKGENEKNFEGFVEFSNVLIKDMYLLNNIFSFINAIPALATLSSPGFDSNGYSIQEGFAHFRMSNNLLNIHQLRTDGTTINIEAYGWIDFENDILKINAELISLKDYSKIISKIPWAGYVILGENGSLSTSLLITGNRDHPEITTNLPAEIIMLPVNVIKRTIEWPFRLFGKVKDLTIENSSTDE